MSISIVKSFLLDISKQIEVPSQRGVYLTHMLFWQFTLVFDNTRFIYRCNLFTQNRTLYKACGYIHMSGYIFFGTSRDIHNLNHITVFVEMVRRYDYSVSVGPCFRTCGCCIALFDIINFASTRVFVVFVNILHGNSKCLLVLFIMLYHSVNLYAVNANHLIITPIYTLYYSVNLYGKSW